MTRRDQLERESAEVDHDVALAELGDAEALRRCLDRLRRLSRRMRGLATNIAALQAEAEVQARREAEGGGGGALGSTVQREIHAWIAPHL